jgi:hypothetical protein
LAICERREQSIGELADALLASRSAIAAIAWSVGIALAAYLWAIRSYNHRPVR